MSDPFEIVLECKCDADDPDGCTKAAAGKPCQCACHYLEECDAFWGADETPDYPMHEG